MGKNNKLDQFYTNSKVSDHFVKVIKRELKEIVEKNNCTFIEPSAGTGNFIKSLIKYHIDCKKIKAYDLDPKNINIKKQDYLDLNIAKKSNRIVIGNPPFGKRAKLAIDFVNKSFEHSSYVAMILPNQFNRFLTQKQIKKNAFLIYSKKVPHSSFIKNNCPYDVKTIFQIWTTNKKYAKRNIRITKPLPKVHKDFETRIHNNTKATLKYFDKKNFAWDIAVHRQGFYKYNNIIYNPKDLKKNRQYFFIKVANKKVLQKIKNNIDFEKLAQSNTQIPGYSTTNFVMAYMEQNDIN